MHKMMGWDVDKKIEICAARDHIEKNYFYGSAQCVTSSIPNLTSNLPQKALKKRVFRLKARLAICLTATR